MNSLSCNQDVKSILDALTRKLRDIQPSTTEFLKYRDEIVAMSDVADDEDELLTNDKELRRRSSLLEVQIAQEKNQENRKRFSLTKQEHAKVAWMLKENSKKIDRKCMEKSSGNVAKIKQTIDWIIHCLDVEQIDEFLHHHHHHHDVESSSIFETATTKIVKLKNEETDLLNEIEELKKRNKGIEDMEQEIAALNENILDLNAQIQEFEGGTNKEILIHRQDMDAKTASTLRLFNCEQMIMMKDKQNIIDQMKNEDACHGKIVEWLKKKIASEERVIKDLSSTYDSTISELNQKHCELEQKRADNLKVLLQLQQRWKQIEAENLRELEERKKMELLHQQTLREHEAATFLQQKLRKCINKNM